LRHSGYVYQGVDVATGTRAKQAKEAGSPEVEAEVKQQADAAMECVSVMRVFDFAGLMEAVGEVEEVLSGRRGSFIEETLDELGEKESEQMVLLGEPHQVQRKIIIQDSQAEGEDADDEDEDPTATEDTAVIQPAAMTTSPSAKPAAPPNPDEEMLDALPIQSASLLPAQGQAATTPSTPPTSRTLLLIPSLPALLSPLMRRNHVTGHALLVHLGRSLAHLTLTHNVCAVVFNATIGEYTPGVSMAEGAEKAAGRGTAEHDNASVFASIRVRPALGRTWPFFLDVSCMVSTARNVDEGKARRSKGRARFVFEVLTDRYRGRVGRWAVFEIGDAGRAEGDGEGRLRGLARVS